MLSGGPSQLPLWDGTPCRRAVGWVRQCAQPSRRCSPNVIGRAWSWPASIDQGALPFAHRPRHSAASSGRLPVVAVSGGSSGGGPGGSSNDKGSGGGDDDMPSDGGGTPLFVKFASLFYAALVAGGGVLGYVKKGSKKSLVAGTTFGLILSACAAGMGTSSLPTSIALISAAALSYVMGRRYVASRKMMPAGITAGVSLLMTGLYTWAIL